MDTMQKMLIFLVFVGIMLILTGLTMLTYIIGTSTMPAVEPQVVVKPVQDVKGDNQAPHILRNLREKAISHDLASHNLQGMSQERQTLTLHSILDNTDTVCNRKLRMGVIGDGGWEICDDEDVRPVGPCVVYSFGINHDYSFDDDTASTYGCHVYSFDPTMRVATHNRSKLVHFHKLGISGERQIRRNGWQFLTFSDIRRRLGHQDTSIDVVKLDVEDSELGVIKEMSVSGEMQKIKQLLVEYLIWRTDLQTHLEVAQIVEKEGFKKFYVHKNTLNMKTVQGIPGQRTACYEVHYVRRPGGTEKGGR